MRNVINKKLSNPSKLVGKVFQRQKSANVDSKESQMTEDPSSLLQEMESLKGQIDSLKATIDTFKLENENKEIKIAKLAREKEKLSMNLAKTRRSNESLAQQLEDERHFYFKEKETYCQEMTEYKKLKKAISNSNLSKISGGEEVDKLKMTLENTLQTNYNLCVKFLRMKETKIQLNNMLNKGDEEHKRIVSNLKIKIDNLRDELKEILNQKFDDSLSPSSKKFIQVVNRNSSLVYENLQLQLQVDHLKHKLRRNKIQKTKSETNSRVQHRSKEKMRSMGDEKVVKIFEKDKRSDLPTLTILKEKDTPLKVAYSSERKIQLPVVNESKLELFQVSRVHSQSSVEQTGTRKRSRSAPKIVQSVTFKGSVKGKAGVE